MHVGVESAEEGVAVLDRIRPWLPVLLALSANSPFWQGQDTGYASFRSQAWNRFPSAELRVADVCLNVAHTVPIATLACGLVDTAVTAWRHHAPPPTVPAGMIRMANWRAAD